MGMIKNVARAVYRGVLWHTSLSRPKGDFHLKYVGLDDPEINPFPRYNLMKDDQVIGLVILEFDHPKKTVVVRNVILGEKHRFSHQPWFKEQDYMRAALTQLAQELGPQYPGWIIDSIPTNKGARYLERLFSNQLPKQ